LPDLKNLITVKFVDKSLWLSGVAWRQAKQCGLAHENAELLNLDAMVGEFLGALPQQFPQITVVKIPQCPCEKAFAKFMDHHVFKQN
jgi:hypothetical protein